MQQERQPNTVRLGDVSATSSEAAEYHYFRARAEYISCLNSPEVSMSNAAVMAPFQTSKLHSQKSHVQLSPYHHSAEGIYETAARLLYLSVTWARNVPAFIQLPFRDQIILLEESWRELFILFAIQWNLSLDINYLLSPFVSSKKPAGPEKVANVSSELRKLQELAAKFRSIKITEEELIFLKAIILFKYGK